jgi:hypothetical protein
VAREFLVRAGDGIELSALVAIQGAEPAHWRREARSFCIAFPTVLRRHNRPEYKLSYRQEFMQPIHIHVINDEHRAIALQASFMCLDFGG